MGSMLVFVPGVFMDLPVPNVGPLILASYLMTRTCILISTGFRSSFVR